jgi:hypothetical protein
MLHELANANLVNVSLKAFQVIDQHATTTKKKLSRMGLTAAEDIVDAAAAAIKRKAVELATGRKQEQ